MDEPTAIYVPCPEPEILSRYVSGSLSERNADKLSAHLRECEHCLRKLDEFAGRSDSLTAALRRPVDDANSEDRRQVDRLIEDAGDVLTRHGTGASTAVDRRNKVIVSVPKFLADLRASGLLSPGDVDRAIDGLPATDSPTLARELVRKGTLTPFQAKALIQGKGRGLVLGNYVVLEKLGMGGMGSVFKALHRRMGRIVCVKVLHAARNKSPQLVERFRREVKAIASLGHPNIIVGFDADEANGQHFLAMEYIEGSDLSKHVERKGTLSVPVALDIVLQTARALEYAHAHGVIHRDIKPHNLILDPTGTVKILDMGLARFDHSLGEAPDALTCLSMTTTGVIVGTVDYMSPEQALNSRHADARSDIYSLGCTLYFLLTRRPLHDGETIMEKLLAHREKPAPTLRGQVPGVTRSVEAVFQRMVAAAPEKRYRSMAELAADLERVIGGRRPLAMKRTRSAARRALPWAGAAMAAGVILAIGLWAGGLFADRAEKSVAVDDKAGWTAEVESTSEGWTGKTVIQSSGDRAVITVKGPDGHSHAFTGRGRGGAVCVLPMEGFCEDHYRAIRSAFKSEGLTVVTASSRTGYARPSGKKMSPVWVDLSLDEAEAKDYDLLVFMDGDPKEFIDQSGWGQEKTAAYVTRWLEEGKVVAGVGQGCKILDAVGCTKERTQKMGWLRVGKLPGTDGFYVYVPSCGDVPGVCEESVEVRRQVAPAPRAK